MPAPRALDFDDLRPQGPFGTPAIAVWRRRVRAFVDAEIAPHLIDWEAAGTFPDTLYRSAAVAGLLGAGFATELGGMGTSGLHERIVLAEELHRLGSGLVFADLATHWVALPPVIALGEPHLRERIARAVLAGEQRMAFAVTEPSGGSDVGAIRATAERRGDVYLLNGEKTLISGALRANYILTALRTGGAGSTGLSLFLIEADRPGVSMTPLPGLAWYSRSNGTLNFSNVEVPASHRLGPEGQGFAGLAGQLNIERLSGIAAALALARVATAEAIAYARSREAFGQRLVAHQVLRHALMGMIRRLQRAYAFLDSVVARIDAGETPVAELALLKIDAAETLEHCAREAMQVLAGRAYMAGSRAERIHREARIFAIAGGPAEVLNDLAARQMGLR
jgi:acyl-CoA dehydrogenase